MLPVTGSRRSSLCYHEIALPKLRVEVLDCLQLRRGQALELRDFLRMLALAKARAPRAWQPMVCFAPPWSRNMLW